ncbi:GNAT family N-acetyltransferase [Paenibacillus albiflavus]|uniref:GNAT family N-acetyltransferase n=1 Tax=Paenibacillus albiflavus TaxID=2545760 RepID=A0A4V2WPM1_9BACL|nr:GNAT family N-acetyltransferase [Paenibacillus albiflavus]TCZ79872.1 GNAT family N-acetyltransferase [Paenibacillus albiflavus]
MEIRVAGVEDAEQIAYVHVNSWRTSYRNLVSEEYLAGLKVDDRTKMWQTILSTYQNSNITYVAVEKGQIVGFINGGQARNKEMPYEAEVYAFYLLEEYQRQGIGSLLFNKITKIFHNMGYKSMMLWVLKDNPSYAFYQKQGGISFDEELITIGNEQLWEVAVGWDDFTHLSL